MYLLQYQLIDQIVRGCVGIKYDNLRVYATRYVKNVLIKFRMARQNERVNLDLRWSQQFIEFNLSYKNCHVVIFHRNAS